MFVPETVLPQILERLGPFLGGDDRRKVLAVRWFNRLYFDIEKWNQDFVALLRSFRGENSRPPQSRIAAFRRKLDRFAEGLEGRWTAEKWDLCCNLRMLSARFARDFAWLEKEDHGCYWELRRLIDQAYGNEHTIIDQARRIVDEVRHRLDCGGAAGGEITSLVNAYVEASRAAIDGLQRVAERAGIQLLTVEQYQLALDRNGSFDARLLVLGDLTMGPKVQTGDNAIVNISSTLSNVVQTIGAAPTIETPVKNELAALLDAFSAELEKIREEHAEEVSLLEGRVGELAKQITKPREQVNRSLLELSRDGLVEAAKTVAAVAPAVLAMAKKIADYIATVWGA